MHDNKGGMNMSCGRFGAMIATSTLVMFGLMHLNTHAPSYVLFSQTRTWMTIVMGATVAIVMIGFMWSMYPSRRANLGVVAGSIVAFTRALWLVRGQQTVDDTPIRRR